MIQNVAIAPSTSLLAPLTELFADGGLLLGQGGMGQSQLIMMLLVGGIFLFIVILPQRRQDKQRQSRVDAVKKGDEVVTRGGIIGTVHSADDPEVLTLQVSEKARIRVLRAEVSDLYKGSSGSAAKSSGPAKSTPTSTAGSTKK